MYKKLITAILNCIVLTVLVYSSQEPKYFINSKWIWCKGETAPINYFQYFRKKVEITTPIKEANLSITADSRYILYLNGEYIGQGPARSFPDFQNYDIYNITDKLKQGNNIISVLVHHYGVKTYQYYPGRGGLLCELELINPQDKVINIGTDSTWKTKQCISYDRYAPRINVHMGFEEHYDATKEIENWKEIDFDDSLWENAIVIGPPNMKPWTTLIRRDIPFLTTTPVYPVKVINNELVNPIQYRFTIYMGHNFIAPDTYSIEQIDWFIYTYIYAAQPEEITFYHLPPAFATKIKRIRVGDQIFSNFDTATRIHNHKIKLNQGWNLFLLEILTESTSLDLDYGLVFDTSQKLIFNYEQNPDDETPKFASITGFTGETADADRDIIFNKGPQAIKSGSEIYSTLEIKPFIKEDVRTNDVFLQTILDKQVQNMKPNIDNINALCQINSVNKTVINPISGYDTRILIDFGKEVVGYTEFEIETLEPEVIFDFNMFETIDADNHAYWTTGTRNSFRYITKKGIQKYRTYIRRGFRYNYITIRNNKQPVKINYVRCLFNTYPVKDIGSFFCSDNLLTRIWETGKYTLQLCMEDTYVDCPCYEQAHWIGDSRIDSLVNYVTFAEYPLARHSLIQAAQSVKYAGVPQPYVPTKTTDFLPAWSFLWVFAVYEYYLFTGDKQTIEIIFPYLKTTWKNISNMQTGRGLISTKGWNMIDWAPMDIVPEAEMTHNNILAAKALEYSAILAGELNKQSEKNSFESLAKQIKESVNKYLWSDEKNAFIDCIHNDNTKSNIVSQQTNILAFLTDVADEQKKEKIKNIIISPPDNVVKMGSPFFMFFVLEALSRLNEHQLSINLIREKYGMMLDNNATTFWESFTDPKQFGQGRGMSLCHGWSSGVTYFLSSKILGVQPVEPGFKKVLIAPITYDLKWAKGVFPTPKGVIKVSWEIVNNILQIRVEAPKDCSCEVKPQETKYKSEIDIKYY